MPLYIVEYDKLGREDYAGPGVAIQVGLEPAIAVQTPVAIGASSLQSVEFNKETRLVLLHTNAICHIRFGTDPAASTNSLRLPADSTVYFGVKKDSRLKVAVITGT